MSATLQRYPAYSSSKRSQRSTQAQWLMSTVSEGGGIKASKPMVVNLSVEDPVVSTSSTTERDKVFESPGLTYSQLAPARRSSEQTTNDQVVRTRPQSWTAQNTPRYFPSLQNDRKITNAYTTLPPHSKKATKEFDDPFETPSTAKRKVFQYHQYEEEENKSTSISFSTLVLIRASEEIPANLKMTAIRHHHPSRPRELSIEKGEHLIALFQKKGLTYVIKRSGESGFVPSNTCFLSSMYQKDEKKVSVFSHKYRITSSLDEEGMRKATVISSHKASTQFELTVQSRESVHLLFSDGQWVYAVSRKMKSGFLPRSLCLIVSKGYTKLHQSTGGGTLQRRKSKPVIQTTSIPSHTQVRRAIHYLKVTQTQQMVPTTLEEVSFSELLLRRANKGSPAYLQVTVIQEYQAVTNDEISVHMNQQLRALYRDGNRLFICSKEGQMGLVPDSICHTGYMYHRDSSKHETVCKRYPFDGSTPYKPIQVMVIQQHLAKQSTELTVYRGEFISVLFYDEHWVYGITDRRQAGFVPSFYCHLNFY